MVPVAAEDGTVAQEASECSNGYMNLCTTMHLKCSASSLTWRENCQLYMKKYELSDWPVVTKFQLKTGRLPLGFCRVHLSVMEVLSVTCTKAWTTEVVEVDENMNFILERWSSHEGL